MIRRFCAIRFNPVNTAGEGMALSHMAELALWEEGRCKCPRCGKYRKRSDIPDQPTYITAVFDGVEAHIHTAPGCKYCLGEDE